MKKLWLLTALLLSWILLTGCNWTTTTETSTTTWDVTVNEQQRPQWWRWGMMWGMNKEPDELTQSILNEVQDKFTYATYTDKETGLSIDYNFYIPSWYIPEDEEVYPLYVFIWDASTVWNDVTKPLTQWIWWIIWATEEDQANHPSYIAIPQFPSWIVTDTERTEYVDLIPRFIQYLTEHYSIDTNRIYEAGQSMWAMTTLYLSANNPWLYSAVLIVDGQWDVSEIEWIKDQTFTYFAAEWDDKAYAWLQAVKAMFDEAWIPYWELNWLNANEEYNDENNAKLIEMYEQWYKQNFVTWEKGTVLEWNGWMEHMASFKHGFKLSAVRDWLFSN